MGIALLAVSVIIMLILKSMEGSIVTRDGQEYAYSVDPIVYQIMLVIALIGVMVVLLTYDEYRWQKRNGKVDDTVDMNQGRTMENLPGHAAGPAAGNNPDQQKKQDRIRVLSELKLHPNRRPEPPQDTVPGPVTTRQEPVIHEPHHNDQEERPARTAEELPGPAQVEEQGTTPQPRPVKFIPVRVMAVGRCPMCGKVIVLDQKECFKCGWNVVPSKLVPFEPDTDSFNSSPGP